MDKEKLKKTIRDNFTIIAIILIVSMISFLLSDKNFFPKSELNIPTNVNKNLTNGTTINMTDDDKNFKNWFYLSFRTITDDINCISKAAKKQNFSDTARCGEFLTSDANISLGQINTYNVSSSMQEALDEYRKSLEDYAIGGSNLEMGAKNMDMQQMNNATMYIQNGTTRMGHIMSLLGNDAQIKLAKTKTG